MIHTNRCKHCNKTKEEHGKLGMSLMNMGGDDCYGFTDSGLAAIDAHKEELWDVLCKITGRSYYKTGVVSDTLIFPSHVEVSIEMWEELESILNQIEKEK